MANSARIDELQRRFAENPRRYFAPLANEYRKSGNLEQAILICQEYLPQQPGHMSGHIVYGQTLFEAGRLAEARSVFETALALDPENLIALHHLGDVARSLGDLNAARTWYRRVLETDPRNEEISQLLAELDGDRAGAATGADTKESPYAEETPYEEESPYADAQSSTPVTIDPSLVTLDEPPPLPTGVDLETEAAVDAVAALPPETVTEAAPSSANADDLELVSWDAHGGEASATPQLTEPEPEPTIAAESAELPATEVTPEEEVLVAGSTDDSADVVESSVLDTELFAEGVAAIEPERVGPGVDLSFEPEPTGGDIERDIDIFAPPTEASPAAPLTPETLEPAPSFANAEAAPPEAAPPETAPIDGGHDGQEIPAPSGEVFVTETMAELYLRQGHLESALDIYRRLVAQRPADSHLRDRLRAVEDLLFGKTVEIEAPVPSPKRTPTLVRALTPAPAEIATVEPPPDETPVHEEASAPAAASGPTIREFLTSILARRAAESTGVPHDNGGSSEAASADAPGAPIDALFPDAAASEASLTAAAMLSEAFTGESETTRLKGLPAHRASSELSLDHVFRTSTPAKGLDSGGSFSFDRFFSHESVEQSPTPTPEQPPSTAGSADDIAEFNAWLSGLKKT